MARRVRRRMTAKAKAASIRNLEKARAARRNSAGVARSRARAQERLAEAKAGFVENTPRKTYKAKAKAKPIPIPNARPGMAKVKPIPPGRPGTAKIQPLSGQKVKNSLTSNYLQGVEADIKAGRRPRQDPVIVAARNAGKLKFTMPLLAQARSQSKALAGKKVEKSGSGTGLSAAYRYLPKHQRNSVNPQYLVNKPRKRGRPRKNA